MQFTSQLLLTPALTFWCGGDECWMHERVEVGADSARSRWMGVVKVPEKTTAHLDRLWWDLCDRHLWLGRNAGLRWEVEEWRHYLSVCLGPPGFCHPVQLTAPSKSHQQNELFGTARFWQIRRMFFYPHSQGFTAKKHCCKEKEKKKHSHPKFAYFLCQIQSRFLQFSSCKSCKFICTIRPGAKFK